MATCNSWLHVALTSLHNLSAHVRAHACSTLCAPGLTPPIVQIMAEADHNLWSEESIEKPPRPREEFTSEVSQGVEDQDTATTGVRVDGEVDKLTEIEHNEPNRSKTVDIDDDGIEEGATFELGVEDSKNLLSLSEELSSILDPKVGRHYHTHLH